MTLSYGSVCSGIEAATVAWHPLGWRPAFFAEIDAFPRAVLAHHYPHVPCHGDFTTIEAGHYAAIDVLVGGTPCQSFSVAGLRGGLGDDRGNLALEYLRLADRLRPRWLVWENVPGVLSSGGGRDFGSIVGGMVECGYGVAWRVLDAQFVRVDGFGRAVPQRRRRVFAIGHFGDWRRAAAVLFERASLRGDPAPRREAGQVAARTLASSLGKRGGVPDANETAHTLTRGAESAGKGGYAGRRQEDDVNIVASAVAPCMRAGGNETGGDRPYGTDVDTCDGLIAHALRADGFDASEDGTGRGTPLVPVGVALRGRDEGATAEITGDVMTALRTGGGGDKPHVLLPDVLAFHARQDPDSGPVTHPLDTDGSSIGILQAWRVRRLMPVECERLQGFPDGYTAIPYRGKPAADGPRYKALGNSMAVNVMRWIGRRIERVEAIPQSRSAA